LLQVLMMGRKGLVYLGLLLAHIFLLDLVAKLIMDGGLGFLQICPQEQQLIVLILGVIVMMVALLIAMAFESQVQKQRNGIQQH